MEEVLVEDKVLETSVEKQESNSSEDLKSLVFSKSLISLILGASLVFVVGFSAYYFILAGGKKTNPVPQKESLLKTTNATPVSQKPANWKIYKDETFKYSLMIPNNWNTFRRASDGSDYQIGIYPSDKGGSPITVSSQLNAQNISAEDFVKNQYGESYPIEKKQIGKNQAVFVKNNDNQYVSYFISKNNRMYELAALSDNEENLKIFDQLLSTFEIVD